MNTGQLFQWVASHPEFEVVMLGQRGNWSACLGRRDDEHRNWISEARSTQEAARLELAGIVAEEIAAGGLPE